MLRTRVVTAVVLLALLLTILSLNSSTVLVVAVAIFFAAAIWESYRLFDNKYAVIGAIVWTGAFAFLAMRDAFLVSTLLYWLCAIILLVRLAPSLSTGLPPLGCFANRLLANTYGIALVGCFGAMLALFQYSTLYLFSVLAIVWVADIGAYFAGKAFGKHKLAPSISPGKSWEGVLGGWLAVLVLGSLTVLHPAFEGTFTADLQLRFGWSGFVGAMTSMVAASIVGDLFESQLKRRIGMKDSSNLLPGHGGVLDRIDALIPTLPMAVLLASWF